MAHQNYESGTRTFTAGAALSRHQRVIFNGTAVVAADGSALESGTVRNTVASGDPVAVCLRTAQGTQTMIAAGIVAAGALVYAAAAGKVDDSGSVEIGHALTAAGADGDFIEVLRK